MSLLERLFRLHDHGTSVGREGLAGLSTFATLSYILFFQPALLANPVCGMDPGGVLFATCIASAVACLVMGLGANLPVALAPGMGLNVFFVFVICGAEGLSWQQALAANLLAGLAFLALAATPLRRAVMTALPGDLRRALAAGIGLLIAFVGLQWGGLVVDDPATLVRLGDLSEPVALLALLGLVVGGALSVRGVPGAILVSIAVTTAVGLATGLLSFHGVVAAPPSPVGTAFELDLGGLFGLGLGDWVAIVLTLFVVDLFDSVGTLLGITERAGLARDRELPRPALLADAVGTVTGAALGTSTVTSYVESAAGVSAGGRTGLTACFVGLLFVGGLFFTPLVETVGAGIDVAAAGEAPLLRYPVLAPVLILVGAMMAGSLADVPWRDPLVALPAFLCVIVMPLSLSITEGLAWGLIARSALAIASRRAGDLALGAHVLAGFFLLRALFLG